MLVATGRGPLAELFARNPERSVYDRPQRKLAMAIVVGVPQVIGELMPWDAAWVARADPNGWLTGAVTPTVRAPVGRLPSGRVVMPLGDTAIAMDPIAGQGANLGNKAAHHVVDTIAAAPDATFDAAWMTATFEAFWADHGAATVKFTNLFLEPMSPAGQLLLVSQYGTNGRGDSARQRLADELMQNFADPRLYTDAFLDKRVARATIAKLSRQSPRRLFAGSMMRIGAKQLGRLLGKQPVHPTATAAE